VNHLDSRGLIALIKRALKEKLTGVINRGKSVLLLGPRQTGKTTLLQDYKVSQDIGVARTTIASYYQILEDCLIVERVTPYTESLSRKKLIKSPKYLFFHLGLRRLAAEEPSVLPEKYLGALCEQFVGLELIRWARLQQTKTSVHFWRDSAGPEVDWILRQHDSLLPIEVRWTDNPSLRDAKHLELFLKDYPLAKMGYIVCRVKQPQMLTSGIEAISWIDLLQRLNTF
jgi:predicted AAA+ superfamily ATPase